MVITTITAVLTTATTGEGMTAAAMNRRIVDVAGSEMEIAAAGGINMLISARERTA
jgi:hypothetical protein